MVWWQIDAIIMLAYGMQHTLLTTKTAVNAYNAILPAWSWNIIYSLVSVLTLVLGFRYWASSGVYLFYLPPGGILFHMSVITLSASLFFFFYCFRYTTSFWQWLGVAVRIRGQKAPEYYRVRKEGIKKYIRFPHHTCLIFLFWTHPVMTEDTFFLAVGATIYLYIGTYHQDRRGLRLIGREWEEYRKNTCLLIPTPKVWVRMYRDVFGKSSEPTPDIVPLKDEVAR
jgi:hypothetical protein